MATPSDDGPFRFEPSYCTRNGRPELHADRRNASRRSMRLIEDQFYVIFGLAGMACLLWRYTIALGAVILGLTTFLWTMRQRSEAIRQRGAPVQEPPQVVHMTLTESGYSLKGDDFFAEAKWSNVMRAFEANGFLLVHSWRVPRLYIPIDELQRAGLYDRVRAIVDVRAEAPARM